MNEPRSNIVSTEWLQTHLDEENLVVLDTTLKKRPDGSLIDAAAACVPGAQEFNYDTDICDRTSDLPHMLPPTEQFESAARLRGISNDTWVVCYDAINVFCSPRAWWMFKIMGHDRVVVLDGGLPKWMAEGRPTHDSLTQAKKPGTFQASFRPDMLVDASQVLGAIGQSEIQTIDARTEGRFHATEPEPRPGMPGGHIPGSSCIPFGELLEDGCFKPVEQLKELLAQGIASNTERIVFSCGSGVTASILALAADECGYTNLSVYDGSWSEWATRDDLPIEN